MDPLQARLAARANTLNAPSTSGIADGHLQANLMILPEKYADDFHRLCNRNTVTCPLLARMKPGDPTVPPHLARDTDIRTDLPEYFVYTEKGKKCTPVKDIKEYWRDDSVAFLIGCSFTFELALTQAGLTPRHFDMGVNCPMYRTTMPVAPAGVFQGQAVVSMRPYRKEDLETVRKISSAYQRTHGEPLAWGYDGAKQLGIKDLNDVQYGHSVEIKEGEIPVFWGCGVTPQSVVLSTGLDETLMAHSPGKMLVLDAPNSYACPKDS